MLWSVLPGVVTWNDVWLPVRMEMNSFFPNMQRLPL